MNDRRPGDKAHDGHVHGDEHHQPAGIRPSPAPAEPGYPEHPELVETRPAPEVTAHAVHEQHARDGAPGHAAHGAHDKHAGHSVAMFRDKFWISLALTIPTLVWGHMLPRVSGFTPPHIPVGAPHRARLRVSGLTCTAAGHSSRAPGASFGRACPG